MNTVSKDLAIKLKEAGYPQDNHTYYYDIYHIGKADEIIELYPQKQKENEHFNSFASPTADELMDRLPCATQQEWFLISKNPSKEEWVIDWNTKNEMFKGKSLADACALMYIFLKEQSLISQKEKIQ